MNGCRTLALLILKLTFWKMLAALGWTQAVRIIILNVLAPVPQAWMGLYISYELPADRTW